MKKMTRKEAALTIKREFTIEEIYDAARDEARQLPVWPRPRRTVDSTPGGYIVLTLREMADQIRKLRADRDVAIEYQVLWEQVARPLQDGSTGEDLLRKAFEKRDEMEAERNYWRWLHDRDLVRIACHFDTLLHAAGLPVRSLWKEQFETPKAAIVAYIQAIIVALEKKKARRKPKP